MGRRPRVSARACACLALLTGALYGAASASDGTPIANLAGRWAGEAMVVPKRGPSETYKCVITYFLSQDASSVRQNLRCQGANYKLDAATQLQIDAKRVTGQWSDNINSLRGTVSGTVTDTGFDIQLTGKFFDAKMLIVSSPCTQSVTLTPERAEPMKELAAVLRKC
jgi:hypothetical protein